MVNKKQMKNKEKLKNREYRGNTVCVESKEIMENTVCIESNEVIKNTSSIENINSVENKDDIKNTEYIKNCYNWNDIKSIVDKLRQPNGCNWDKSQDYKSLIKCIKNESEEVIEAVVNEDVINLKEELGDLLFLIVLYSNIAKENGDFTIDDVIDKVSKKMINRHPHVFENENSRDTTELEEKGIRKWDAIKFLEKQETLKEYEKLYELGKIDGKLLDRKRSEIENLKIKYNM